MSLWNVAETVIFDGTNTQTIRTCNGCASGNFNNIGIRNNSATTAFLDAFSVVNFTGTFASTALTFEHSQTVYHFRITYS